jgi:hypothetical protein
MSTAGSFRQLAGLVLLRATLLKNQLFRPGRRAAGVLAILVVLAMAAVALATGVASFFLGMSLSGEKGEFLPYVWHGYVGSFLIFWFIGLMADLQRAEALDIRRLLHLPISIDRLFVLNFLTSLACFSVVFVGSGALGLALGTAVTRGPFQLLVLPVAAAVVLAVAAVSYELSGWLATLMENKRTRRTVLTLIPVAVIVLAQVPHLFVSFTSDREEVVAPAEPAGKVAELERERARLERRLRRAEREEEAFHAFQVATGFLPPLWPGAAATALLEGDARWALLGTLASFGIACWALLRALRTARRHYLEGGGEAAPPPKPSALAAPSARPPRFLELSIPGVPEDVAALATASLRMLLREPVFRISLLSLPILAIALGAVAKGGGAAPEWQRHFLPAMAAAMSLIVVHKHAMNLFGTDRDGFRQLVLLPTPRARILLGRNLALLPVTLALGVVALALLAAFRGFTAGQWVTGLLDIAFAHTISCTIGNFLSVLNPFRISADATAQNKARPSFLAVLELLLALPLVNLPLLLPALAEMVAGSLGAFPGLPVAPLVALVLLGLAVAAYVAFLPAAGAFLERRERDVLEKLTRVSE